MKQKSLPPVGVTATKFLLNDSHEEEDLKEVYWPDFEETPGETSIIFRLRFVFSRAGYRVKQIEEVPAPPVIILRAVRIQAPRIREDKPFFNHIRDLLRGVGFHLKKDELTVDQDRDRILVAFLSGKPVPDFEEILREQEEDWANYPAAPL